MLSRMVIVLLCLVAAIACYAMGLHAGIVVFVLLGVMSELVFWVVLTRRAPPVTKVPKTY